MPPAGHLPQVVETYGQVYAPETLLQRGVGASFFVEGGGGFSDPHEDIFCEEGYRMYFGHNAGEPFESGFEVQDSDILCFRNAPADRAGRRPCPTADRACQPRQSTAPADRPSESDSILNKRDKHFETLKNKLGFP